MINLSLTVPKNNLNIDTEGGPSLAVPGCAGAAAPARYRHRPA